MKKNEKEIKITPPLKMTTSPHLQNDCKVNTITILTASEGYGTPLNICNLSNLFCQQANEVPQL